MNRALGLTTEAATLMSQIAGLIELSAAGCLIVFSRSRWPLQLTIIAVTGLLAYVALFTPNLLTGAFNPVTTNTLMAALAFERLRAIRAQDDGPR